MVPDGQSAHKVKVNNLHIFVIIILHMNYREAIDQIKAKLADTPEKISAAIA